MPAYLIPSADGLPWLTLLLLTPLLGMVLVGIAGAMRLDDRIVKLGVLAWTGVPIALAALITAGFNPNATADGQAALQFVEKIPWIDSIRVDYFMAVDGLSLPMVLLTVVMTPLGVIASWGVNTRVKTHFALLLLLEAAMLGYFVALNFFFFFIFWEFSLVPAYFLIQLWGRENRRYAAFKFFIYTMAGSVGMLLLFQVIYLATRYAGAPTFDLITLGRLGQGLPVEGVTGSLRDVIFNYMQHLGVAESLGRYPLLYTSIAFWAIFIAFAIKLAVWPFHTWLPDAYSEAPVAGSVLLSAVMSKMGAYGMLRIMLPLVPDAAQYFAPVMGGLALVGIVAGAFGALANISGDVKRLIGYTSINHMGYVMLAIAAAAALPGGASQDSRAIAINGALMQMVAHGLSTGALFYLAGALQQRTGSWELNGLGGLRTVAPTFAGVMGMAMFANLGLPGLAGFVGEFFIFRGAWATLPLFTALAVIGLIITALALLIMYQRIFLGPTGEAAQGFADLRPMELWSTVPFLVLLLILGVYPAPIMNLANAAATQLVAVFLQALS
ncbi:proton-translocating NADH-quinone oxidoreductase, chain M [Oscillochloris trichoides DG-6]|uniref:Proton-translocating NADH-quinone oxidoreductase, chain M n=1 Tax=Oscillochloris trichoides DG-6 TaxID=765420 RepID=E1IHS3_9CHLR|nr:NADH-quinone oxidoreductase subunit M [Oscillochloris trichoides]EFO79260.1 proton-translocating NADH-quinone oxidoreductase, chain M [Oscillochloris trichoides DG-6]